MSRVLLLLPTTTYRTQAFLDAAQRLGAQVTVASEEPSTLTGMNPAGLLTLDFSDPARAARQAVEFAARHPIDAVVPVDDQVVVVGAAICRALGLPWNSVESAAAARDKHCMRELLARADVAQPNFQLGSLTDDHVRLAGQVSYPCVIKPLSLAASRGVIRADNAAEFVAAVARLSAILQADAAETAKQRSASGQAAGKSLSERPVGAHSVTSMKYSVLSTACPDPTPRSPRADHQFLVEQFIPGPEVALEGLLSRGKLHVLALFDKPDPLNGPFFEETIYVTPSRLPAGVQDEIARTTARACEAIGLSEGPVHAELRVNVRSDPIHRIPADADRMNAVTTNEAGQCGECPWVIEINPRSIGGLCSRVLRFGTGLSLEELIIQHALQPDFKPPQREHQAAGVMMIPIPRRGVLKAVRGMAEAQAVPAIEHVTIAARTGQELVPLPEGSLYLGFIFARAESPALVESALRNGHARLEFVIEP